MGDQITRNFPVYREKTMKKISIVIAILMCLLVTPMLITALAIEPGPNLEAQAIKRVSPNYPPLAKLKKIEGKVMVKLTLDSEGMVTTVEFLDGNGLFKPASIEAAKKWTFKKTQAGKSGHIIFNFQLEDE
jgi:TonB family protein